MYTRQPKKLLIINILDILQKYTDENHKLSQKDIAEILKREYGMEADRKAVRRNLLNLMDFGYEIEYTETIRKIPVKDTATGEPVIDPATGEPVMEERELWSDFYLKKQFTDGELRLLIDSLLFSSHIPARQCKDLIHKLEGLSNVYFQSRVKHIFCDPAGKSDNKQLFLNIELLDDAISKKRKVTFRYMEYGTDKKLHPRKREDGSPRDYLINPYQMAARDGKYYLICSHEKYDTVSNYRIDLIQDIEILDKPVKPFEQLRGSGGKALDLAAYMEEHPYMYSSENIRVKMRISRPMIGEVLETFGIDVRFSDEDETGTTVTVNTNEMAAKQFAKRYAPDVRVLEPKTLREKIRAELERVLETYV